MAYLQISIKKTGRQNIPTGKLVPGGLKNKSNKITAKPLHKNHAGALH